MSKSGEQNPRQAAEEYRQQQSDPQPASRPAGGSPPRNEAEWRDLISRRIDEATQNGEFDNLPGRGKPLQLNRNPYAPDGAEMAFDLLQKNNLAPAWIGARTALLRDLERWRLHVAALVQQVAVELGPTAGNAQAAPLTAGDGALERWAAQRRILQSEVDALNRRIVDVNLQQPIAHLEILRVRLDDELRAAGAGAWP